MPTVKPDTSPAAVLSRFRGLVTKARLTYPERAAINLADNEGGSWYLATWWADYSPADPEVFSGKTVVGADIGKAPGELTIDFSDGASFTIGPIWDERDDAIENWELFTPDGMVLTYGPRGRWQLGSANDPC
ncbi:MAG: hypothetical protein ACRDPE_12590 [Solirubrobacterales bacterium]